MYRHPRILAEAPVGRHFCQLHHHPDELTRAVTEYVQAGLCAGNAVLVIATTARLAAVRDALQDADACVESRQLTLLDACDVLPRILVDGRPDLATCRRLFGEVLKNIADARHRHTRVYGELVSLLWNRGGTDDALKLEVIWNDLAREHRFSLFCGYEIAGLDEAACDAPLADIAQVHSDMIETDADDRLQRAIDRASVDILGLPLSSALCYFGQEQQAGEQRLPAARRTVMWLRRNMPAAVGKVLARARVHYAMG